MPSMEMESELTALRTEVVALREADAERSEAVRAAERDLVEKCQRMEQAELQVRELEKLLLEKNEELAESLAKSQVRWVLKFKYY